MSDDLSKVDWTRPIEAVRACGRTAVVEPAGMPSQPNMYYAGRVESMRYAFDKNGYPLSGLCPWRIRNVAEPVQLSPSDAVTLTADQAAMLRKVLEAIGKCEHIDSSYKSIYVPLHLVNEARRVATLLPEPVDGDVLEARGICAGIALRRGDQGLAAEYTAGLCDSQFEMEAVIASVRTRALERDSREG